MSSKETKVTIFYPPRSNDSAADNRADSETGASTISQEDRTALPDPLDASLSELVEQLGVLSRSCPVTPPIEPEPENETGLAPLSHSDLAVVRIPMQGSLDSDLELDRILKKLDVLHQSLLRMREPDSPALRDSAPESQPREQQNRASLALFASQVRSPERREYVIGCTIALTKPLGLLSGGSKGKWILLIGIAVVLSAALWAWSARDRFTDQDFLAHSRDISALPAANSAIANARGQRQNPSLKVTQPNREPGPEAILETDRGSSTDPVSPGNVTVSEMQAIETVSVPISPEVAKGPDAAPAAAESQRAFKKLASQAETILRDRGNQPQPSRPVASGAAERIADRPRPEAAPLGPASVSSLQPTAPDKASRPVATLKVLPNYPEEARRLNLTGQVDLVVAIDEQGQVVEVFPLSGPDLLRGAAVEAMKQWRFKPAVLNGASVPGKWKFSIVFGGD